MSFDPSDLFSQVREERRLEATTLTARPGIPPIVHSPREPTPKPPERNTAYDHLADINPSNPCTDPTCPLCAPFAALRQPHEQSPTPELSFTGGYRDSARPLALVPHKAPWWRLLRAWVTGTFRAMKRREARRRAARKPLPELVEIVLKLSVRDRHARE